MTAVLCPKYACSLRVTPALINAKVPQMCVYCQRLTRSPLNTLCDRCSDTRQCCARCDTPLGDGDFYVARTEAAVEQVLALSEVATDSVLRTALVEGLQHARELYAGKTVEQIKQIVLFEALEEFHMKLKHVVENPTPAWLKILSSQ